MSKASRRKNRRHRNRHHNAAVSEMTPQQLFDRGDYKTAKERLMQIIDAQPTDKNKRLLAWCLCELNKSEEAASTLLGLSNKTVQDYVLAGRCYLGLKRWDDAADCFGASLEPRETANGYYWLAIAKAQNAKHPHQKVFTLVVGLLEKAIALPECCPEAYLWLDELYDVDFGESCRQIRVLQSGLTRHPHSRDIRLALVSRLFFDKGDYDSAASTLQPLLTGEDDTAEPLWYSLQIEQRRGNLNQAVKAVELLQIRHDDSTDGPGLSQIKGELLLRLGRTQEAFACFEPELSKQSIDARILAHLGRTLAYVQANNGKLALQDARSAINLWATEYDVEGYLPGSPTAIRLDETCYDFNFTTYYVMIDVLERMEGSAEAATILEHARYLVDRIERRDTIPTAYLHTLAGTQGWAVAEFDLSDRYIEEGNIAQGVIHFLRAAADYFKHTGRPISYDIGGLFGYSPPASHDRARIHSAIVQCINANDMPAFIPCVIAPLYRDFWRGVLFDGNMFQEVLDVATFLCEQLADDDRPLFDKAFALGTLGRANEAEPIYRELLSVQPDNSAALHNLSLIVADKGDLDEAAALSDRAASLSPDNPKMTNQRESLREQIGIRRGEEQRREQFLRTARERWPQLDYYKRKILSTLLMLAPCDDLRQLAEYSCTGEQYFPGNWRKLVTLGMVVEVGNGAFCVNEHIVDLVNQERTHAVATTLVRADNRIAFKPIFNSRLEHTVYNVLIGLFPNHLVFPNMSLQTIFQYDQMKELLDSETFTYFLMSQVDFCVTSTANYLPIIAFEVDSPYHDLPEQQRRDAKKNGIFQCGGVPLLRLRAHGRPGEGAMRQEIIEQVRKLGQQLAETNEAVDGLVKLALEIDFERFGVDEPLPETPENVACQLEQGAERSAVDER